MLTGAQSDFPAVAAAVGEKKKLAHIRFCHFAPRDIGKFHIGRQLHFLALSATITILSKIENQSLRDALVQRSIAKIPRNRC